MSSSAVPRPSSPQRTIGEILLANGYVDQAQHDRAIERQLETGFPLGQILVEAGAITRLELASALAVQWSDMPIAVRLEDDDRRSLTTEDGGERKALVAPAVDLAWQEELASSVHVLDNRLEKLESALADLEARDRQEQLLRGLEQLDSRVGTSEAVLAEAARRSAESVTHDELEERLGTLAAALEAALARADELEARSVALAPRIEEVSAEAERASAELEQRSIGFTDVVDALAGRIDSLPDMAQLEELSRAVARLGEQPSGDPSAGARLDELAQGVAALSARVDELTGETAWLGSVPADVEERLAHVSQASDALAARVAEATQSWTSERAVLEQRLSELAVRVESSESAAPDASAATAPDGARPETSAADDLNRLWFAVERISLQLTEHHRDIDTLLVRNQGDDRLEQLAARLDDLEGRPVATVGPAATSENGQPEPGDSDVGSRSVARKLELERSVRSERDKLLTQVEQMLGSLEWRLQRLESTGSAAPTLGS